MAEKTLSSIEQDEIMYLIKNKEFTKTGRLFEGFGLLINSSYDKNIKNRYRLSLEDFRSQCHVLIMNCIKSFRGSTFGQLCNLITKTIIQKSKTIGFKHDKHCKYNILGEAEDNSSLIVEPQLSCFEDQILSVLTLNSYQKKHLQDELTEYEVKLIKTYIYDGDFKEIAVRRGVKYESVMKALERVLEKLRKIAISLGITSSNDDYIIA